MKEMRGAERAQERGGETDRIAYLAFLGTLLAWTFWMFYTAPTDGAFSVNESSRNALNGAFVRDLFASLPFSDPYGWATDYYYQYPALTILFYPPLFFFVLAGAYGLFGVSHSVAVATVLATNLLLGLGLYAVGRRTMSAVGAASFALLFLTGLEVADVSRQVLLEIPMLAFLIWAVWAGLRFIDTKRSLYLYACALLALAAVYTKQTGFYVFIALGFVLVSYSGLSLFRNRHTWIAIFSTLLLLVPLIILQLKFASFNLVNISDLHPQSLPILSIQSLTHYLRLMPAALSWPTVIASIFGLGVVFFIRRRREGMRSDLALMLLWFFLGYAALTAIQMKTTARVGLPLYVPVAYFGGWLIDHVLVGRSKVFAAIVLIGSSVIASGSYLPPGYVTGYRAAAEQVLAVAEPDARVMFSGHRDGDFIFNIRELDQAKNVSVLRSDKLFLNIAIMPELGVDAKEFTETEISDLLNKVAVSYVVTTPEFWTHIPVMNRLWSTLNSPQFEKIAELPSLRVSRGGTRSESLLIYRNRGPLADPPAPYNIKLKAIDVEISQD